MSRVRVALVIVGVLLVAANVVAKFGPSGAMLLLGPLAAVALILVGRWAGLGFLELGLGRHQLLRGAVYAAVAIVVVAAGMLLLVSLPPTHGLLSDQRYQLPISRALWTSFVVIPLGTILPEEIAFRGVLWGLLARGRGPAVATGVSSALFGLWHILPSLRLSVVNPAVSAAVGVGGAAAVVAVAGAVLFTTLAGIVFCELRRHSGSLLAPVGLHWAVNGLGVLVTSALAGRN
ncbi:CPBP family intramembrane glutamic endopeptidase [Luedemannella helvata]|uniref:CPBP family intramembrane metalloprotease n=1 Tax=Luedemannella helvata TaxID=349315 RepID=A0ABP4WJP4_9ACTN